MTRAPGLRLGSLIVAACIALIAGILVGRGSGSAGDAGTGAGSTLDGVWVDLDGNGTLERGPGEAPVERTELAAASPPARTLATLVQITDLHVRDEESPARASLLDRVDPVLNSTFRPQEATSPHVLAGIVNATNATDPDAVLVTGDLIDSAQANELDQFLATVTGGTVHPGSGAPGYEGPQERSNPDPFFYRPDLDAPRHPGLLDAAQEPFESPGLNAPWHPLVGNHDLLVQGEVAPTQALGRLATGDRLITSIEDGISVPRRSLPQEAPGTPAGGDIPEETALTPELVDELIGSGLPGPSKRIAPDPGRAHLTPPEALARLREASGSGGSGPLMDYSVDVGTDVRVLTIDLVNRAGGSGGVVHAGQGEWLAGELERAGERHVILVTHQPIDGSAGGDELQALLDRDPDVIATLAGDTHANSIAPRQTSAGGYWEIETSSLADYPQQARAIQVVETEDGGIALQTWMLDGIDSDLATTARELSYLDAQGGRPQGNAGEAGDRNALLYR